MAPNRKAKFSLEAVMQVLSSWGAFPATPGLAEDLPLRSSGSAILLLRDARVGPSWHVAMGLSADQKAEVDSPDWRQPVPALTTQLRGTPRAGEELIAWWRGDRRPAGRAVRGLTTRERGERSAEVVFSHWRQIDAATRAYVHVPAEDADGTRVETLEQWASHALYVPHLTTLPGEVMSSFVMWEDAAGDSTRVAVEIEAEPDGLVLAVLLFESTQVAALRDVVVRTAPTLAEIASRTYWASWERFHQRRIGDAIPRVIDASRAAAISSSPVDLFRCVMPTLDPMLLEIAGAMHAPVAGLFLANQSREEIELIGHVGYQNPGQPQVFKYKTGLTRLFSWDVKPIVRAHGQRRAFHIATVPDIIRADQNFGIQRDHGPGGVTYTSDEWVLPPLKEIATVGPWAWGHVPFDRGTWHAPKRAEQRVIRSAAIEEYQLDIDGGDTAPAPSGVVKVYGRIRSEIDHAGSIPFARRELIMLHRWSALLAAVLQRVASVYGDFLGNSVIQRAAHALSTSLQHFVGHLRDALAPQAVLVLSEQPGAEQFKVVAEHWHSRVSDGDRRAVKRVVETAADGSPGRTALSSGVMRTGLEMMIEREDGPAWNSLFQPILVGGYPGALLVLVGAPANLQPAHRDESCTRPFPPMLRPTVEILAAMLAGRTELARAGEVTFDHDFRAAWRRLVKRFKRSTYQNLSGATRAKLDQFAADLAASLRHQHELAELLEVEPQTARRQLMRLLGADGPGGDGLDWRTLGARGTPRETFELVAALVDISADLH